MDAISLRGLWSKHEGGLVLQRTRHPLPTTHTRVRTERERERERETEACAVTLTVVCVRKAGHSLFVSSKQYILNNNTLC